MTSPTSPPRTHPPGTTPPRPRYAPLAPLAALLIALAHHARAQTTELDPDAPANTPAAPASPAPPPPRPDDDHVTLATVGLSFIPPIGAVMVRAPGENAVRLELPDALGTLIVHDRTARDATAPEVREFIRQTLRRELGVFEDDPAGGERRLVRTLASFRDADRVIDTGVHGVVPLYAAFPSLRSVMDGDRFEDPEAELRGYAVFDAGRDRFAVFELFGTVRAMDRLIPLYEALLATVAPIAGSDEAGRRGVWIRAGRELADGITNTELRSLLGEDGLSEWRRLFTTQPGPGGAELGYMNLQAAIGRRGELTERPRERWSGAELDEGLVVKIFSRLVEDGRRIESRSLAFATLDGREESWFVELLIPDEDGSGRAQRWRETGERIGDQLKVVVFPPSGAPTEHDPPVPFGYLSRAHAQVVGPLAAMRGLEQTLGFYVYDSQINGVAYREDVVSIAPPGAGGAMMVTTRPHPDREPYAAVYRADGRLVRTELSGGRVWEPTPFERLREIWRQPPGR